jgi:hypothetical protein
MRIRLGDLKRLIKEEVAGGIDAEMQRLMDEKPTPALMAQLSDEALEAAKQRWPGSKVAMSAGHELLKRRSASGDSDAASVLAMANNPNAPPKGMFRGGGRRR